MCVCAVIMEMLIIRNLGRPVSMQIIPSQLRQTVHFTGGHILRRALEEAVLGVE